MLPTKETSTKLTSPIKLCCNGRKLENWVRTSCPLQGIVIYPVYLQYLNLPELKEIREKSPSHLQEKHERIKKQAEYVSIQDRIKKSTEKKTLFIYSEKALIERL